MNRRSFFKNVGLLCGGAMLKVAPAASGFAALTEAQKKTLFECLEIPYPAEDFITEVEMIGPPPTIELSVHYPDSYVVVWDRGGEIVFENYKK